MNVQEIQGQLRHNYNYPKERNTFAKIYPSPTPLEVTKVPSNLNSEKTKSTHSGDLPLTQVKLELTQAIAQLKICQRQQMARLFYTRLSQTVDLQQVNISTNAPDEMSIDDISKLATYAYEAHPNIFQEVLLEQKQLIDYLSNALISVLISIIASRWLN